MCGRYENASSNEELQEIFSKYAGTLDIAYDLEDILKEQNIAPTNYVKVIVLEDSVFKLKVMKWGIRSKIYDPSRLPKGLDPNIEKDIFNSKIETLSKSARWKKLFSNSRCLFPMTAFYEWIPGNGKKIPQRINLKKEKIFFSAGIFMEKDIKGEESSSIITCEPNTFMKKVHNRMPAIITPKDTDRFLSDEDAARQICEPLDDSVKMEIEKADI
jgi:putative SOS response-associated peptidase YedK